MTDGEERDRWNARFGADGYLFGTAPNAFLASQGSLLRPGQRALAVADGEGRNGVWLASLGLEVLSVDFSPVALAKARKLATETGAALQTECVDLSAWTWPAQRFDIVAAIFIQFAPPPLRTILFQGMKDALKPGGLIVLEAFRAEQIERHAAGARGGPRDVALLYSVEALREDFGGEHILTLEPAEARVDEGRLHQGDSAVVRALVRKR